MLVWLSRGIPDAHKIDALLSRKELCILKEGVVVVVHCQNIVLLLFFGESTEASVVDYHQTKPKSVFRLLNLLAHLFKQVNELVRS